MWDSDSGDILCYGDYVSKTTEQIIKPQDKLKCLSLGHNMYKIMIDHYEDTEWICLSQGKGPRG